MFYLRNIFVLVVIVFVLRFDGIEGKSVSKRAVFGDFWPTTRIPYEFSSWAEFNYKSRRIIEDSIQELENKLKVDGVTCIDFVPRDDEKDYILFVDNGDCSSSVGYVPGKNIISLGRDCIRKPSIIHEIMHRYLYKKFNF